MNCCVAVTTIVDRSLARFDGEINQKRLLVCTLVLIIFSKEQYGEVNNGFEMQGLSDPKLLSGVAISVS